MIAPFVTINAVQQSESAAKRLTSNVICGLFSCTLWNLPVPHAFEFNAEGNVLGFPFYNDSKMSL